MISTIALPAAMTPTRRTGGILVTAGVITVSATRSSGAPCVGCGRDTPCDECEEAAEDLRDMLEMFDTDKDGTISEE